MTLQQAIEDYGHIPLLFSKYVDGLFYFEGGDVATRIEATVTPSNIWEVRKDKHEHLSSCDWSVVFIYVNDELTYTIC